MNAKLIKALRCCIVDFNSTQSRRCNECSYRIYADGKKACENKAKRDAANALEADDKRIAELMPKEAHWVAVENGHGICSNCNRQDRIDNLATHCRYCGARIKGDRNERSNC